MGGSPVPDVPYGEPVAPSEAAPGPSVVPATTPRWLRRFTEEPDPLPAHGTVLLAEPPRAVPLAYRLSALTLRGWFLFAVVMVTLAPMALWLLSPLARTVALVLGVPVLLALVARRYVRSTGILRWGRVATVVDTRAATNNSSFTNWPMRQARGWDVSTMVLNGRGTTTEIRYTLDGHAGTVRLSGLPYVDGVVLADSRHPERAAVVSQFPHAVRPGVDGRFGGRLPAGLWLLVIASLAVELGLAALLVWAVAGLLAA